MCSCWWFYSIFPSFQFSSHLTRKQPLVCVILWLKFVLKILRLWASPLCQSCCAWLKNIFRVSASSQGFFGFHIPLVPHQSSSLMNTLESSEEYLECLSQPLSISLISGFSLLNFWLGFQTP